MYYTRCNSKFGKIILVGDEQGLTHLTFTDKFEQTGLERNDDFFSKVVMQLEEYFSGHRIKFDLKLNPQGTEFQKSVWKKLMKIPFGATCSYKDIAEAIGKPTASRAVGMANGKNPIAIIIPCHRVIGANGKLTGYAFGLKLKRRLLELESGEMVKQLSS